MGEGHSLRCRPRTRQNTKILLVPEEHEKFGSFLQNYVTFLSLKKIPFANSVTFPGFVSV